jgi:hypothetical protein
MTEQQQPAIRFQQLVRALQLRDKERQKVEAELIAKIVAWLRKESRKEPRLSVGWAADKIEAREWEQK